MQKFILLFKMFYFFKIQFDYASYSAKFFFSVVLLEVGFLWGRMQG